MAWFDAMHVSLSSLEASRARMEAAASNLSNADSSARDDGSLYQVQRVSIQENRTEDPQGPSVVAGVRHELHQMNLPPRLHYDPGHPDADEQGMVRYPDVDIVTEMSELINSRRAYDAALSAYSESRSMFLKTLEIGKT